MVVCNGGSCWLGMKGWTESVAVSQLCFWHSSGVSMSHSVSRVKCAEVKHSNHTVLESLLLLFDMLSIIHILNLFPAVMHFLTLP